MGEAAGTAILFDNMADGLDDNAAAGAFGRLENLILFQYDSVCIFRSKCHRNIHFGIYSIVHLQAGKHGADFPFVLFWSVSC